MKRISAFIYSLFTIVNDWMFAFMVRTGMVLEMASTAISAQGSTLKIGTATAGAKTISGAAIGFPTILTATAHGLSNGDVVTIAAIVGTLSAMNGSTFVVKDITANTFMVEYNSTGLAYTSGGTATPVQWTPIKNLNTFSGFDGQPSELDRTNLDSTAKELILGLVDFGMFTVNMDQDNADAGQIAARAAYVSGAVKNFVLTLPNTNTATFSAYVKRFGVAGGVDKIVEVPSMDLRITGAVTWA